MENSVECRICKESVLLTNATEMTPRQLAGIKVDKSNIEVSALVMIAQSMVMFNNPPDSADKPMFWICNQCIQSLASYSKTSANYSSKKWWQFWK